MTTRGYQELIIEGIKGLPPELLAEITDFIYFIRRRVTEPKNYAEELESILLNKTLQQLDQDWTTHLEEEFVDYDKHYPIE